MKGNNCLLLLETSAEKILYFCNVPYSGLPITKAYLSFQLYSSSMYSIVIKYKYIYLIKTNAEGFTCG